MEKRGDRPFDFAQEEKVRISAEGAESAEFAEKRREEKRREEKAGRSPR